MEAQLNEFGSLSITVRRCGKHPQGHAAILTTSMLARRKGLQRGKCGSQNMAAEGHYVAAGFILRTS